MLVGAAGDTTAVNCSAGWLPLASPMGALTKGRFNSVQLHAWNPGATEPGANGPAGVTPGAAHTGSAIGVPPKLELPGRYATCWGSTSQTTMLLECASVLLVALTTRL